MSRPTEIAEAASILAEARYCVALTGAGISVPSGIPDFRSRGSGLWEEFNPMEVASIGGFRSQPERFYNWIRPLVETMLQAKPNAGHLALTTLQKLGCLNELLTQNIDGLHQAAESRDVLPLHGHTLSATCLGCSDQRDSEPLWEQVVAGEVPHCEACGDVYKPDVVLFGEMLPAALLMQASDAVGQADAILVAGSSLEVYPVAGFPQAVLDAGGKLVIVNIGPTSYDDQATLKIEADVTEALPAIAQAIAGQR